MIKKYILSRELNKAADKFEKNVDKHTDKTVKGIASILEATEETTIALQLTGSMMRLFRIILIACVTPGKEGDAIRTFVQEGYQALVKRMRKAAGIAETLANNKKIKRAIEAVEDDWAEYSEYVTKRTEKAIAKAAKAKAKAEAKNKSVWAVDEEVLAKMETEEIEARAKEALAKVESEAKARYEAKAKYKVKTEDKGEDQETDTIKKIMHRVLSATETFQTIADEPVAGRVDTLYHLQSAFQMIQSLDISDEDSRFITYRLGVIKDTVDVVKGAADTNDLEMLSRMNSMIVQFFRDIELLTTSITGLVGYGVADALHIVKDED